MRAHAPTLEEISGDAHIVPCSLSAAYATSMGTQMRVITHKWFLLYW